MTDNNDPLALSERPGSASIQRRGDAESVERTFEANRNIRRSIHRWITRLLIAAIVIGGFPLHLIGSQGVRIVNSGSGSPGNSIQSNFAQWAEHETQAPPEPGVSHE